MTSALRDAATSATHKRKNCILRNNFIVGERWAALHGAQSSDFGSAIARRALKMKLLPEARGQRSEASCQRLEIRGQKSEVGGQREGEPENERRKSKVESRKAEGGRRKAEGGRRGG